MSNPPISNSIPTLRQYQREDVDFLKTLTCAGCFNEQRTGKTPTSIVSFVERGITKILIVCTNSALYTWAKEFTLWSNGLPAVVASGTPKQKQKIIDNWENGALIISYGSVKTTQKSDGLLDSILRKKPQGAILDEAHRIKERTTANAKAAFQIARSVPYRIALTGTPAPNKPHEIWGILHFLYPQEYKSYWKFIEDFFYTRDVCMGNNIFKDIGTVKADKIKELQNILNSISTQRKRKDVMAWLPDKDYQRVLLPPTLEQVRYLEELAKFFETEDIVTQGVLDRLTRYRQICLHPALLQLKGQSPKLNWIKDYLKDYPERPTIIFTKFTSFIRILSTELKDIPHALIIGETSDKQRAENIAAFQRGDIKLLILNIDAGKESLTLDTAEAVIFTDKYPPVGDIEQAEDRFVATVETKANKPHVIYELVMKGTYDEQLYALIEKRAEAIDVINNFKTHMKGGK